VKPNSYTLFSWGGGAGLAQNIPTSVRISSPVQVPGTTWGSLANASWANESMAAIKTDGTLWAWGDNESGMLGQNSNVQYSSPVQVGSGTDWGRAAINQRNLLASKTDGTLWVTGYGPFGCLANDYGSGSANRSSPIQIPGTTWATGVQQLAQGEGVGVAGQSFFALKTNGTLWAWGGPNDFGGLGSNNRTIYSSPIQIPGTTWTTVSAGDNCTIATRTDGTLWSWGYNGFGTLGLNNTTYYSSPVQIPGTDWKQASMGRCNAAAIRTDGTLWCWGRNQGGSLGQGNNTQYSSPKQVPGTTWDYIEVGSKSMLGVKTDGTIWTWGNNEYGTLGHNNSGNPTNLNSPVQVGSDTDYYRNKGAQAGMGGNYFVIKQV
jgi:alpha-tubulin suppressor-like RCC1 family protein